MSTFLTSFTFILGIIALAVVVCSEDRGLRPNARQAALAVMSRDVVESVEGYAANRRVVSVVVVEVEPAGQRQASFGL